MPFSPEFIDLFDAKHPRNEFETQAVYDDYRRTAYRWYKLGMIAQKNTQKEWCSLCGGDHYTDAARKQCGALFNATKNDKE